MPDIQYQQALLWHRIAVKAEHFLALVCSHRMLMLAVLLMVPGLSLADTTASPGAAEKADPNGYDIAVIIDNRETAGRASAKEDVKAITEMLDRHMFADHIIQLERPSFPVICDIFGGCPSEASHVWPSLLAQITDRRQSRLFVYYLGPARVEGRERQFLFDDGPGRTAPYAVGWLHKQLEKTGPKSALVMIEASFAPRRLPCASDDPRLIDAALRTVKRNYAEVMKGRGLPPDLAEISAAMPAEAPHCDRFDLLGHEIERPLFTKYLLKGVVEGLADQQPFGDRDGLIELGELEAYTHDNVRRAVQFQWGRIQNVWKVGPSARAIASTAPREPTFREKQAKATTAEETTVEKAPEPVKPPPTPKEKPAPVADPAPKPSVAPKPHVCDEDQESETCRQFCAVNPGDFRCPYLGVCVDAAVSEDCPCLADDPRPECADTDTGDWCRWSGAELGPGARTAITSLGGEPANVCAWATRDESDRAPDVLWEVFGPIGWRLIRPVAKSSAACVFRCGGVEQDRTASLAEVETRAAEPLELRRSHPAQEAADQDPAEPVERADRTDLAREICNPSLPPYIALPRWMPGTLIISDLLRSYADCDRPSWLPRFDHGLPPPITLAEAPPLPKPAYQPPPPFPLPPPIELPPITMIEAEAEVPLPRFEPTVGQIRWLQSALTVGNHDPGPIDGVIGQRTNRAIQSWRSERGAGNVVGDLTRTEFNGIVTEFGDLFHQVQPEAPLY